MRSLVARLDSLIHFGPYHRALYRFVKVRAPASAASPGL